MKKRDYEKTEKAQGNSFEKIKAFMAGELNSHELEVARRIFEKDEKRRGIKPFDATGSGIDPEASGESVEKAQSVDLEEQFEQVTELSPEEQELAHKFFEILKRRNEVQHFEALISIIEHGTARLKSKD